MVKIAVEEKKELAPTSEFFSFVEKGIRNLENNIGNLNNMYQRAVFDHSFSSYNFSKSVRDYKKKLEQEDQLLNNKK